MAVASPSNSAQLTNDMSQPYISSPEFMVDELTALRNFNSYSGMTPPLFDSSVFSDLDNPANDVFLPGSAYEALHTALRNRQLWTARPDIPSRPGSPISAPDSVPDRRRSDSRARTGRFELSPDRENILWQNYLNEICLWVSGIVPTISVQSTNKPAGHVRQPPPLRLDIPPDGQVGAAPALLHPRPLSPADGAQAEREIAVRESVSVPGGHPSASAGARKQDDSCDCLLRDSLCTGDAQLYHPSSLTLDTRS